MRYVDTSALLTFPDRDDANNAPVVDSLTPILAERRGITHNYVVIETAAPNADSAVESYSSWPKMSSPCSR